MKKLLISLAALCGIFSCASAEGEPTLAERVKTHYEASKAFKNDDERRPYYLEQEAIDLADEVFANVPKSESNRAMRHTVLRVGYFHYLDENPATAKAMLEYANGFQVLTAYVWSEQEIRDNAMDKPGLFNTMLTAERRLEVSGLLDQYVNSRLGEGELHRAYQQWFREQLAGLSVSAAIPMLVDEIRGVMTQPESDARDKWLVELRGQLHILQELPQ